ncbi:hypothetical protein ABZT51_51685 [Streptomyces sp. NPDC005373]|uniref:hypothetical protein n=1 Tax=Streptomyces sp. NPDC005373 TaxID=3156879 RepID=UPI0033A8F7FD
MLLRGHGLTSTGGGVPEAVLRAVSLDTLVRLTLDITQAGAAPCWSCPGRTWPNSPTWAAPSTTTPPGATSWPGSTRDQE